MYYVDPVWVCMSDDDSDCVIKALLGIYLMIITLASVGFSFAFLWAISSKKSFPAEQRLFDKAKLKYTDGDNT